LIVSSISLKNKILATSTVLLILSLSYFPLNNSVTAKDPTDLINPFIADKDSCGDSNDNDGDGFVDDNCGTMSLKVTNNMSGAVSNVSSICHEDCHFDADDLE
jgi:hypothetical protein